MSEIVVWGECPVGIHVDTETGRVTRVVVLDENLRYPEDIDTPLEDGELAVSTEGYQAPWGALDVRDLKGVERVREDARRALAIAREGGDEPWPAWQFGY